MRSQLLTMLLILVTIIAATYVMILIYRWRLKYLPQIIGIGGLTIGSTLTLLGIREVWVSVVFFYGSLVALIVLTFYVQRRPLR
jgi:hypothetical protein